MENKGNGKKETGGFTNLKHFDQNNSKGLEDVAVGMHFVNHDGIIVWANQTQMDMLGYMPEEYIGHHISEFHADEKTIHDILQRLSRKETLNLYEARVKAKDGGLRHVIINSNVLWEGDKFIHTRCFTLDVTPQKQERIRLVESEKRYQEFINALPTAFYSCNAEGYIELYNESAVTLWGRKPQIGKEMWCGSLKIFKPDGSPLPLGDCPMAIALQEGKSVSFEIIIERPDGTQRNVMPYPQPLYDTAGNISGAVNTLIDITEMRRQEQKIQQLLGVERKARKEIQDLFMQAPAIIAVLRGPRHIFELANAGYMELIGYRDIIGKPVREALPEVEGQGLFEILDEVYRTGQPFIGNEVPVQLQRLSGKIENGFFNFVYKASRNAYDEIDGILVYAVEITEQVEARKLIEQSQREFSTLANNIQNLAWMADAEGYIFWYNQRWFEYTGTTFKDMAGWGWQAVHHPQHLSAVMQKWEECIATGKPFEMVFPIKGADNVYRSFLTRVLPITNEKGKVSRWIGTNTDIEEQKNLSEKLEGSVQKRTLELNQANMALAKKTEQLIEAQQMAHLGSWEWDVIANKIEWSDELFRIFGLKPQEFEATYENYLQYIHPDDRDYVNNVVQEAFNTHKPYLFSHRLLHSDGTVRVVTSTGKVFSDDNGNAIRMAGIAQDITEQVKSETALKKSEERYHRMVGEVEDYAILYLSEDGIIENWNKGAEKIKGYTAQEILGKHFSVFYTPEDIQSLLPYNLLQYARENGVARHEGWRKRKDGTLFWGSVVITALHDQQQNVIGFSKVTRDLTHQKKAEDKVNETAAKLRHKNEQLEKMNKELESFTYVSSHDLQEPLRKIQTFTTRILEKEAQNLSETGKAQFNRLCDAASRMQTLIQDLLAYSHSSRKEEEYVKINLSDIIADVKKDLSEELETSGATIILSEMCEAYIIPFQFRQLLHNLIGNSLKFAKPGVAPRIRIESEQKLGSQLPNANLLAKQAYCHIRIEDNGIGFDTVYRDKIFQIFQRLHRREEYSGTGIGLAIVKKIIDNHNGFITATGKPGEGAVFDIYIPATSIFENEM